jgi:hypothetical protein
VLLLIGGLIAMAITLARRFRAMRARRQARVNPGQ